MARVASCSGGWAQAQPARETERQISFIALSRSIVQDCSGTKGRTGARIVNYSRPDPVLCEFVDVVEQIWSLDFEDVGRAEDYEDIYVLVGAAVERTVMRQGS